MPVLSLVMPFKGQGDIDFALSLATLIAMREIKTNRHIPRLYDTKAKIKWKRDVCRAPNVPGACERFLSPLQVLAEGGIVDCDDAGPWRAAELRLAGDKDARAKSKPSNVGYHVIVVHGDGTVEDPSKKLGMGKRRKRRGLRRAPWARKRAA